MQRTRRASLRVGLLGHIGARQTGESGPDQVVLLRVDSPSPIRVKATSAWWYWLRSDVTAPSSIRPEATRGFGLTMAAGGGAAAPANNPQQSIKQLAARV